MACLQRHMPPRQQEQKSCRDEEHVLPSGFGYGMLAPTLNHLLLERMKVSYSRIGTSMSLGIRMRLTPTVPMTGSLVAWILGAWFSLLPGRTDADADEPSAST